MAHAGRVSTSQQLSDGEFATRSLGYVWDPIALDYVLATPITGGGGGGGPVTVLNGADVAEGATTDLEAAAGNGSVIAILKRLRTLLSNPLAVTGTFWQATQPVSGPLTDAQLRAAAVPVSGPLTDAQLRAAVVPVDVSDRPARTLGIIASIAAAVDISDRVGRLLGVIANLPAALTAAGNLKVSLQEDGGAVIGVDDNAGSLTVDAPVGTPLFARLSDGAAALAGQKTMALSLPVAIASDQSAVPVSFAAAAVLFKGRASTFRTLGRAGAAGQKILSIYNAGASPVKVTVNKVAVDLGQTVVKAVTTAPPIVRLWKITAAPTNGTVLGKSKIGGSGASNASVEVRGDASADGTGSATTLTATLPAGTILTQEFAARLITAAGYEVADRLEFLGDTTVELLAGEGVVVFLDYTLAAQNPITDMWISSIEWSEN